MGHTNVIDLGGKAVSKILICLILKRTGALLTVLNEKMAMTLSQGESALGSHPIILDNALATRSDLSQDWARVNVLPVRPQVKGFRLFATG